MSTSIENGRPGEFHAALWLIRPGTPRFYPDAVTTAGVEAAPAQLKAIADLIGSNRRREWFVKDGFHCLRLEQLGFEPLFDAEWIAMCSTRPHAGHHQPGDRSTIVTDEAGLSAWERPRVGENTKAIGSDEMDYRGEKIRLSKKYVDYDDDKNDPANLAASEISRVDAAFRMLLTRYRLGSSAVVGARCQCGISQKDGFACVFVDGAVTGPPASA